VQQTELLGQMLGESGLSRPRLANDEDAMGLSVGCLDQVLLGTRDKVILGHSCSG
jgi:hypothetical protein